MRVFTKAKTVKCLKTIGDQMFEILGIEHVADQ